MGDPGFTAPRNGDSSLPADSPALALGFRPLDASIAGPRRAVVHAASVDDLPVVEIDTSPILIADLEPANPAQPSAGGTGREALWYKPALLLPTDLEPVAMAWTVRNVGGIRAEGNVDVVVEPSGAATIVGDSTLSYDLGRGEAAALAFSVEPAPGAERVRIEGRPHGEGLPPTARYLDRRHRWRIPRIPPLAAAGEAGPRLAEQPAQHVMFGEAALAEIRAAFTTRDLALCANVVDGSVERGGAARRGACIEVFASLPGEDVHRICLFPRCGDEPARGFQTRPNLQHAPRIRVESAPADGGYRLCALIPVDMLGLTEDAAFFLAEFRITTFAPRSRGLQHVTLFGSSAPDWGSFAYAEVTVMP